MGIKSRAGLGISILNIGVFDITSKVQVHFNCYHTHDLAFLNVIRKEFLREILDMLVNITIWCFLG